MSDHDRLTEALRSHADRMGDTSPLTLDDVKGRATGIRRRRAAVSGLAAAAVLAVAVPIGIAVTDQPGSRQVDPADTPSVAPDTRGVLTTDLEPDGSEPGIPYVYREDLHRPDGTVSPLDRFYGAIAAFGDGWVTSDTASGQVAFLAPDGDVLRTEDARGAAAVSPDGTVVTWATGDGRLMTLGTSGTEFEMPLPAATPDSIEPVAVQGSESCDPEDGAGCVVYFNDTGSETPHAYHVTSKGISSELAGFRKLNGMTSDGRVSGVVSVDDLKPGSCSEVRASAFDDTAAWSTCEHTVGEFSPDGRYVVGHPAYLDGIGDPSLAILDATTGEVLAEWVNSGPQAFAGEVAWDEDGTLLAPVLQDGAWSLMRFRPDGGLTKVMDLESIEELPAPIVMATAR